MAVFGYQNLGFGAGAGDESPEEIAVDAIDFNGTNAQIRYTNNVYRYTNPPDSDSPGTGSTHTISFWLKPETISAFDCIVSTGTYGSFTSEEIRLTGTGALQFLYNGSDNSNIEVIQSNGTISTGSWHHIMLSWTENTPRLFINGSLDSHTEIGNGADLTGQATNDTFFGTRSTGASRYDGCLAEYWHGNRGYEDTTKFRSENGKPVRLPTDVTNYIYLSGSSTTWSNNGTGDLGTQTLSNITDCADSPSD